MIVRSKLASALAMAALAGSLTLGASAFAQSSRPARPASKPAAAAATEAKDKAADKAGEKLAEAKEAMAAARKPLAVGETVPEGKLTDANGTEKTLADVLAGKKTVLIFYRGGWCPYCTKHLQEVSGIEGDLRELGYQIVAVSPDSPANFKATAEKQQVGYQLYSDADLTLAKNFGLAFGLDEQTIKTYHGYGIDLPKASGGKNAANELPHPALYLIDEDGTVRFAHHNPDYTKRVSAKEIMEAASTN